MATALALEVTNYRTSNSAQLNIQFSENDLEELTWQVFKEIVGVQAAYMGVESLGEVEFLDLSGGTMDPVLGYAKPKEALAAFVAGNISAFYEIDVI